MYLLLFSLHLHVHTHTHSCLTFSTETKGLVADQFIGREAVMELYHLHILWPQARLLEGLLSSHLGHVVAHLQEGGEAPV